MLDRLANLLDGAFVVFSPHVEGTECEIRFVVVGIQLDCLLDVFNRLFVLKNGSIRGTAEAVGLGILRINRDRTRERRDGFVAAAEDDERLAVTEERIAARW